MKLFAHRGHGLQFPESTRLAFEKALDAGCDGLYVGVQKAKDNVYVVANDANLKRLTGENAFIWDLNSQDIVRLNVDYPKREESGLSSLMVLDDFLDLIKERRCLASIEMVARLYGGDHTEHELARHISERNLWDQVVLMGYDHEAVARCKDAVPEGHYGLGLICQMHHLPEYIALTGADHLFLKGSYINPELVKKLHAQGISLHAEYICSTEELRRLQHVGCDVANTPYPQAVQDLKANEDIVYGESLEQAMARGGIPANASMNGIDVSQMRRR